MAVPPIRIKVSASTDASWDRVFGNVTGAARKARKDVAKEAQGIGTELAKGVKVGTDKAEEAYNKMVAVIMGKGGRMMDPGTKAVKDFVTETKSNFSQAKSSFESLAKDAEKNMARVKKAQDDAAKGSKSTFGKDVMGAGRAAFGVGREVARFGLGVAGDLARGAGVDTNFGSIVKKNNDTEDLAVALSNQSVVAGSARNSKRVDPKELVAQARQVGMDTGQDAGGILTGMNSFVAKTGDLATARDSMAGLAKLSKATGTSMEDMVSAAGDYSLALGDVPDKGQKIVEMMTRAAAEGKKGSLPIADMANKMAQLSGAAVQYGGNVQKNTQMMIAMAQMARMGGGADTAAKQTSAVMGFTSMFGKGQRLDAFKNAGVTTNDADGRIRNPRDVLIDALRVTGKDPKNQTAEMAKMFASAPAQRISNAALLTYRNAGSGEAGLEAVKKQMDDLADSTMDVKEINDSFAAAMDTNSSKANQFNTQMAIVVDQLQISLTPALTALAPVIISATSSLAKFISIMTGTTVDDPNKKVILDTDVMTDNVNNAGGTLTDDQKTQALSQLDAARKQLDDAKAAAAKSYADRTDVGSQQDSVARMADAIIPGANPFEGLLEKDRDDAARDKGNVDQLTAKIDQLSAALTGAGINVHVKTFPATPIGAPPGNPVPLPK